MARIQPSNSDAENELIDRVAELTRTRRTDVVKNALAAYYWLVRQALTGARVTARKPTGEEVILETPELAILEGGGRKLGPDELKTLAQRLAATDDPAEALRLREMITRGFYGV